MYCGRVQQAVVGLGYFSLSFLKKNSLLGGLSNSTGHCQCVSPKVNETQVLLALMVTREGLPIGYEVFPGATLELDPADWTVNGLR